MWFVCWKGIFDQIYFLHEVFPPPILLQISNHLFLWFSIEISHQIPQKIEEELGEDEEEMAWDGLI